MMKAGLLLRSLTVLLLAATVPLTWSQPVGIREFAAATVDNVVRIEARWANDATESGFGYIVGLASHRMTVATARHVVAAMVNSEYQAAQKIVIITRGGKRYVGETVAIANDSNADLAFIDFVTDSSALFMPSVVAQLPPAPGEEVWLFGTKGEIKLNPTSGRVSGMTSTLVRVASLGGVEGVSGAPVISSRGLVGLYLGGDPSAAASVLQIGVIQRRAASLQRTWTLTTCPCSLPTIAVQFLRADTLDVPVSTVGPASANGLKVPGIHNLAPGSYGLNFDIKRVECLPRSFVISVSSPSQRIEVSCSPRLDGTWSSPDAEAVVTALGSGDYELITVARNNLPSNSLRGRLIQTNTANQFQTNVADLLGRDRSGSMVVSQDLLEMKITIPVGIGDSRIMILRRQ
jgi:hypothetical protein